MDTDALTCYAAGYFDGEGCVEVYPNSARGFNMVLSITSTDVRPLMLLHEHYGGTLRKRTMSRRNWAQPYRWTLSRTEAEVFARAILPFTITKHDQLVAYLNMRTLVGLPHKVEERQRICAEIKVMKRDLP